MTIIFVKASKSGTEYEFYCPDGFALESKKQAFCKETPKAL
jgi:hypothetical protein